VIGSVARSGQCDLWLTETPALATPRVPRYRPLATRGVSLTVACSAMSGPSLATRSSIPLVIGDAKGDLRVGRYPDGLPRALGDRTA
jgi:hypothetical protein